jgi:DNA repair protein RecN (Recombination protein N)
MRIRDVAVIERLEVDFAPGLNLLTGETGAGKSILLDALGLVLGGRATSELIRSGAESAVVEAGFTLDPMPKALARRLREAGIDLEEEEIVIRREIGASGRGKITVNGVAGARQLLREIAPFLADIHGQGDNSTLLRAEAGLEILDRFGGSRDQRREVREAFRELRRLEREIESAAERARETDSRRLVLESSLAEVEKAAPRAFEDDELLSERRIVSHGEKLKSLSAEIWGALYDDEGSALSRLRLVYKRIEELAAIDDRWKAYLADRDSLLSQLEDLSLYARDYAQEIDVSPGRLDEIESRLALLERLKKKHHGTLDEVLAFRESARRELDELEGSEERILALEKESERVRKRYLDLARALSNTRHKSAKQLEKRVAKELQSLALEKARFLLQVTTAERDADATRFRDSGLDEAEILFSANPGEEPRPLARTASGGEMSRFVLALKTVSAKGERSKTLVFDEVDSGIGGRVADAIGEKLRELAQIHQVICVTHLPQIASFAPAHYRVDKMEREGRTETRIARLDPEERVNEIARMLAGAVVTETARDHARQLVRDKSLV